MPRKNFIAMGTMTAIVVLGLLVVVPVVQEPPPVQAYSNCRPEPEKVLVGGPHRTINQLAVERFLRALPDSDVRRGCVHASIAVAGPRPVERSPWERPAREEAQGLTWRAWVADGGFSADEPELFNSFRHFYDPLSLSPEPEDLMKRGVPFLTDHMNQIATYLDKNIITRLGKGMITDVATWKVNVRVDAKSWAITGAAGSGNTPNPYCWEKGREYFTAAFTGTSAGSHPDFNVNLGMLKHDPYELYADQEMVKNLVPEPGKADLVPGGTQGQLNNGKDPGTLFDVVAIFNNRHFFSADNDRRPESIREIPLSEAV